MSDLEQGSLAFRRQYWKIALLSPMPAIVLTLGYLSLLFDLTSLERATLACCLVGSVVVASLAAEGHDGFRAGKDRLLQECQTVVGSEASQGLVAASGAVGQIAGQRCSEQSVDVVASLLPASGPNDRGLFVELSFELEHDSLRCAVGMG